MTLLCFPLLGKSWRRSKVRGAHGVPSFWTSKSIILAKTVWKFIPFCDCLGSIWLKGGEITPSGAIGSLLIFIKRVLTGHEKCAVFSFWNTSLRESVSSLWQLQSAVKISSDQTVVNGKEKQVDCSWPKYQFQILLLLSVCHAELWKLDGCLLL